MSNDVYICDPEFEVVKIIVKKLPHRCHPENCQFAWISKPGNLFCHARGNELVREVKRSKDFTIPSMCPLVDEESEYWLHFTPFTG